MTTEPLHTPSTSPGERGLVLLAELFVGRGWAVHPLVPRSKRPPPKSRGWCAATHDVARVREWWGLEPDANIGIRTGKKSGIWVLDVDGLSDGEANLERLVQAHGSIPTTFSVWTGHGRHLYFAWPEGVEVCIGNRPLCPGIDVHGEHGYVVGPGSVHPTGRVYEVESDADVADAPPWLLALARL